jgi:hypothetical protein
MVAAFGRRRNQMSVADTRITEFTDPGCPWAFSAEPFRRRLNWLYGDCIEWEARRVGLAESPRDYEERGFEPSATARHAHRHPRAPACTT